MKGGFCGLKGKEISLITIVIMSATIIIWSWEKTPGLTAFLPPQTQLQLSSEEVRTHVIEDELPSQTDSAQSYSGKNRGESNARTASYKEEILSSVVDEEKQHKEVQEAGKNNGLERLANSKEIERKRHQPKEEKTSKQGEQTKDSVNFLAEDVRTHVIEDELPSQMDSAQSYSGKNMGESNARTASYKEEILSSILDGEVQGKEVLDAEKNDGQESLTSTKDFKRKRPQSRKEKTSKQGEQKKDLISPMDFAERSTSLGGKGKGNHNNVTADKACNYAKGKWVPDNKRPLYSGFDCKQWLSPMWSCRLTQRTDFAYENLRWQPKDCQMEAFERSKFFRRMQNKTLAFVGDSLGRQQFQSLMCMITGGKETKNVEDVGKEYGLIVADGAARPNGWAYRFPSTNTTILYYWSAILCDVEPIDINNPATDHAMHLDRPPSFLRQYIHKFDVLVLNTGHHWNRGKLKANRWVMHVGGVPNTDKKIAVIWGAKNLTINSVVHWVDSQLPKYPGLKAFFTTLSPRHFMGGDWNTGGSCDNTTPMSVGKEILDDESADQIAANAVKGTGVKLLDITAPSQIRDEGHISRFSIKAQPGVQDCLHWCLPGVPDTWNEILFAQI